MTKSIEEALYSWRKQEAVSFHVPGHLGRGPESSRYDTTELTGLDNLHHPEGILKQAQEEAAQLVGAQKAYFLVNGASVGIQAAILAACQEKEEIIVPRNVHMSVLSGLILSGATPVFCPVMQDETWLLPKPYTIEEMQKVMQAHPKAKACLVTHADYHGLCADLTATAQLCRAQQCLLLADEAHGSHFAFLPDGPVSAKEAGADLSVQSFHKTMGSYTQSAILCNFSGRLSVGKYLHFLQSTSPSYLLMDSLQKAVRLWLADGAQLGQQLSDLAQKARMQIAQIEGIAVLPNQDPSRLVIKGPKSGAHLAAFLAQNGIYVEMAERKAVTLVLTYAHQESDIELLVQVLWSYAKQYREIEEEQCSLPLFSLPQMVCTPREAVRKESKNCPLSQAIGHIAADMVIPYPPGIPVLLPGEEISAETVCLLQELVQRPGEIIGLEKDSAICLKVIK